MNHTKTYDKCETTYPSNLLRWHRTSELSIITNYDEPELVFNERRAKTILQASALITVAAGFAAIVMGGMILDIGVEIEKAFGGCYFRLVGSIVSILGFSVFVGGFVCVHNIDKGNMYIVYIVVRVIATCMVLFAGLSAVFEIHLSGASQEAENKTEEGFRKLNDTIFQQAILRLQYNHLCCGVYGPKFYNNTLDLPPSCCGEKSWEMSSASSLSSWPCSVRTASGTGCIEVVKLALNKIYRRTTLVLLSVVVVEALILLLDYLIVTRGETIISVLFSQN